MIKPKGGPATPPSQPAQAPTPAKGPAVGAIKRRSSRVAIDMPVEVFGQSTDGKVFREETRTTVVNAHGALIVFGSAAQIKPSVILINKKTHTEAHCRVIFLKKTDMGKSEMSVEFVEPQPRFWGIAFPPDDWDNADRKKPSSGPR